MKTCILTGDHDERGRLFAAYNPDVHHIEPAVMASRFSAYLAPYKTHDEAEQALLTAGAVIRGLDG